MKQDTSIAILAPGLLGGSLALAVKEFSPQTEIRIWARRVEALDEVRQRLPSAFCSTSIAEILHGATLAVLCMPVQHMQAAAKTILAAATHPELLVTDVGSVKGSVVSSLEPLFAAKGIPFIGSHPMAGSHATGMAHARGDLFQNAACLLTPLESTSASALGRLRAFWSALGCRVLEMNPLEHDRRVARISHLPHTMAAVTTLAALAGDTSPIPCAAGGFRDTTRVAAGDPAMWTGILRDNRAEVLSALRDARGHIEQLIEHLSQDDEQALHQFLASAKALRDQVPAQRMK
ncbi:MAG: prephenate dehydrogenase [bacterium]